MDKKKIAQTNEKIAEAVAGGYRKIEEAVVEGYKKIEDTVVDGYKRMEEGIVEGFEKVNDKFVEKLFAGEGESVEDAKKRLNGEKTEKETTGGNKND